jgi:hypothetical protein
MSENNTLDAPPAAAADALAEIDRVRQRTRSDLQAFWFPLVLFGGLTLVSVPVALLAGWAAAVFWAVAGPVGGGVVAHYDYRRETRLGLTRSGLPYVLTAVGLMAGAFVLPAITTGRMREVAAAFAVAAGYLVFAALERSWTVAAVAAGMAAVAAAALASGVERPGLIAWTVIGVVMLGTGLVLRGRSHQQ